ncbi:MAG: hypothetical protein JO104_06990, partial [Candidatus Eremiobacteraeota bacterium]|nr:hypothetical protein [Candidatus Eremiobacteraeota bacterium]
MSGPSEHKRTSLFIALVYLAGCAGNGSPSTTMPAAAASRHDPAHELSEGYSITDLCPAQGNAPCGVGGGGGLPTFDESEGSINTSGQAVGQSTNARFQPTATLFDHGKIINLNTLGAINSAGDAINDSGQVAG